MIRPEGTITLLFTDIEGSTRLWESQPDAMQAALATHDALLRRAIETHDGYVFKTVGDAFCAAFPTAPDALAATLQAQLAIAAESWPEKTPIKVRMALHTGAVESRDNDYFGQPLNRVARLLSTGHGGQTLLSQTTYDLVRDSLPVGVTLKDLGEHRLKDLARPEQVYQLLHPGLPESFPALKSLAAFPNNLPQQVTSFIGREKELLEVEGLLEKTRLLTLTGSGGSGKSRLSLQLAADLLESFPDGAFLVELAPLSDPSFVAQTVASALGLKEEPGKAIVTTLAEHLKSKKLLLLLDNCEHVLDASAKLVDALIRSCPGVKVLATSREGLGIAGETTYRVPSLSLPDPRQAQTAESLSPFESVQLFLDRALQAKPGFEATNENAPALASICFRLDGIPLAIELAAARVRSLSLEEINSKLDQRFRLLTGGSRTALPRQQTLRSLIDWSYNLLSAEERRVLERLSVFAGGWTLESAEAVCVSEEIEDWEVLDYLTSLCDKSLVLSEERSGRTRYRYLETVRQYARERLLDSGEGEAVRERHRAFFLALAEEAEPKLQGSEQAEWLERLEEEHENLRVALDGSLQSADPLEALRFCGALNWFWRIRGYLSEGRDWCVQALDKSGADAKTRERANTLNSVGIMACFQGGYPVAKAYLEESLGIGREIGYKIGIANSLVNLGIVASDQSNYPVAKAYYEESLEINREIENKFGIATSLTHLGILFLYQDNYILANDYFEESLKIARETGNKSMIAGSLNNLGIVASMHGEKISEKDYYEESLKISREVGNKNSIADTVLNLGILHKEQGSYPAAKTYLEESIAIFREIGNKAGFAGSLLNLGIVALDQSEYISAQSFFEESLRIAQEIGQKLRIADSLQAFGSLAGKEKKILRAAALWGTAEALLEEVGAPLPSDEREKYDKEVADARAALNDDAAFDAAWQEGRAMSLEQAIDLALEKSS